MNAANGHGGPGAGAVVALARPVVLVRYRPGVIGETARTVHVVALPTDQQAGVVGALCGAVLMLADIETVTPGEGMPCTVCVVVHRRWAPRRPGNQAQATPAVPTLRGVRLVEPATSSGPGR